MGFVDDDDTDDCQTSCNMGITLFRDNWEDAQLEHAITIGFDAGDVGMGLRPHEDCMTALAALKAWIETKLASLDPVDPVDPVDPAPVVDGTGGIDFDVDLTGADDDAAVDEEDEDDDGCFDPVTFAMKRLIKRSEIKKAKAKKQHEYEQQMEMLHTHTEEYYERIERAIAETSGKAVDRVILSSEERALYPLIEERATIEIILSAKADKEDKGPFVYSEYRDDERCHELRIVNWSEHGLYFVFVPKTRGGELFELRMLDSVCLQRIMPLIRERRYYSFAKKLYDEIARDTEPYDDEWWFNKCAAEIPGLRFSTESEATKVLGILSQMENMKPWFETYDLSVNKEDPRNKYSDYIICVTPKPEYWVIGKKRAREERPDLFSDDEDVSEPPTKKQKT